MYGRDNMEELFLIPREMLGGKSLIDYMTKVELRQKTEGSYTTLLYYGKAFSVSEISGKIRDLYYWLNNLSTVGFSQTVDLDKKQILSQRLAAPDTTELSGFLQELEQYAKRGRYDQLRKSIAKAFAQWEKERRPQLWLEHSARRILNFIRIHTGDEESLIESEYQLEDIFITLPAWRCCGKTCRPSCFAQMEAGRRKNSRWTLSNFSGILKNI